MRRPDLMEWVRPVIEEEGFELVDCTISRTSRSQVFRVFIDRDPGGVTIEACAKISRRISSVLDANPLLRGTYLLEVSSAGMNRAIWLPEHFERFRGERVRAEVIGPQGQSRHIHGTIEGIHDNRVRIRLDAGGEEVLSLSEIGKANLQIDPWSPRRAGVRASGAADDAPVVTRSESADDTSRRSPDDSSNEPRDDTLNESSDDTSNTTPGAQAGGRDHPGPKR